jgi:hypothetical protein
MNNPSNVVEYADDLIFAACEFRWEKGDKFALIEAIAICAANDREYPQWVRDQINAAMTGIFGAVFPDVSLVGGRKGLGISALIDTDRRLKMKAAFDRSTKSAKQLLSLSLDRKEIIGSHINAVRDFHLAELVERFADFKPNHKPQFQDTTKIMNDLAEALSLTVSDWEVCVDEDASFGPINGKTVKFSTVEPVCRTASFNILRDAWREYREFFEEVRLNERAED